MVAEHVVVAATREHLDLIESARADLMEAGRISTLELLAQADGNAEVQVTLAADE